MPEIKRFGDRGILVNFEQKIETKINEQVIKLSEDLLQQHANSLLYTIPAYCSLTIQYDPKQTTFAELSASIERLLNKNTSQTITTRRQLEIPVCYDRTFGLDIAEICTSKGISSEALIAEHSQPTYRVYMLGFLPGFVYLGKLPQALWCKRRKDPRLRVPAQSVAIAGAQTGIYPSEAPGGWNILGRTPLPLISPDSTEPFLFKAGDLVNFNSISVQEFHEIEQRVKEGTYKVQVAYV